jgi:hypothetical protein
MKKLLLLVSLFVIVALTSNMNAQPYASAIGLRLGYPIAASYKFFVSEPAAVELYAGIRYDGLNLGGMYQVHKPLSDVDNLYWYFGGGASISFYSYYVDENEVSFGINGVIGLDYTFEDAPINLSIDYMPTFLFGGYYDGYGSYGALSARYILGQ